MRPYRRRVCLLLGAMLLTMVAAVEGPAAAQAAIPTPPCGVAPIPPYAPLGAAPNVLTGAGSGLSTAIDTGSCVRWDARAMSLLVLVAGQFRDTGGVQDLLARFGAISRRPYIRYFSVTDNKTEPLLAAASAVADPGGETHRGDFTPAELADGAPHYFVQEDNRSTGEVTYSMRAVLITANRLVVTIENTTPVKSYFIRLFDPGDLRATYYLDQLRPGVWGYYGLSGIQESSVTGDHRDSYANRAIAEFNHIATMAP